MELLARESALLRDRALLAREVEFLRHITLSTANQPDMLGSTQRHLVDDILNNLRIEGEGNLPEMSTGGPASETPPLLTKEELAT